MDKWTTQEKVGLFVGLGSMIALVGGIIIGMLV